MTRSVALLLLAVALLTLPVRAGPSQPLDRLEAFPGNGAQEKNPGGIDPLTGWMHRAEAQGSEFGLARLGNASDRFKERLQDIVAGSPAGPRAGIYIQVLRSGRVLYSQQGHLPMVPASNQKLLTTLAALDRLGPDFRYRTEVLAAEPDASGVVAGNLYLRGTGDPTLGGLYAQPGSEALRFFAQQLRARGVRVVAGDLVADDSAFDRCYLAAGWLERYRLDSYSAPVSALSFNGNVVEVVVSSRGVTTEPPSLGLRLVKELKTGSYSEVLVDRPGPDDTIVVRGQIAPGQVVRRAITVGNPPLFTAGAFAHILKKAGIQVRGRVRLVDEAGEVARTPGLVTYARFLSPPLSEMIAEINKHSDNLFAEHLFKALGEACYGRGSAQTGCQAVRDYMERQGIPSEGLAMVDGSGLSRLNRVSPAQIVGMLASGWRHPRAQLFMESLPAPGEGTLRYRLGGLRVRAKTGTLARDSSLSGYVVTGYGQTVAFSILVNDVDSTWSAIELQDRIVRLLAGWPEPL
jgi:D-alanyl-D-alanine carboxypeptidase/D-alanyl-D-alanine-endopeptidase (penicillin-binding protein 4)